MQLMNNLFRLMHVFITSYFTFFLRSLNRYSFPQPSSSLKATPLSRSPLRPNLPQCTPHTLFPYMDPPDFVISSSDGTRP